MHQGKLVFLTVLMAATGLVAGAASAAPWWVSLPDTVTISGDRVLLRQIAQEPVPASAGGLVLRAGAAPNTMVAISRQTILRKLVTAGLSQGVRFKGAETCRVSFAGRELNVDALAAEIRRALQDLVPPGVAGAPASWFEFEYPALTVSAAGDWRIKLNRHQPLAPGRNLVQVRIEAGNHHEILGASVVLHCFGEVATAVTAIPRDMPLTEEQFTWSWVDLAEVERAVVVGRASLVGASATRSLAVGNQLRTSDLQETPMIMAGDPVELVVTRGQVAVTVRAYARQKGCLNQTIPVRNELTGRLVNARVAGPGLVEWRR